MPELSLKTLLPALIQAGGSDLHLETGMPPLMRLHGQIRPLEGFPVVDRGGMKALIGEMLDRKQGETLMRDLELDLAYALPGLGRFRVNWFHERNGFAAVMRLIPERIPTMEEIGLPPVCEQLIHLPRGLVLFTGPTGSGKSTSLAAMLGAIRQLRPGDHVLTVEDPVEFLHANRAGQAVVRQREVGRDVHSFARGLRAAMRQDPDVILVGEMRDLETIETAITAAETGHLVFGTLHTSSAPSTINRIVDVFPPVQQQQIRAQLAATVEAIITQTLLPRKGDAGRVAAHEVLVVTDAVRNMIREEKLEQVRSVMQTRSDLGMQTMDKALADLVSAGTVERAVALERAQSPEELTRLLERRGEAATARPQAAKSAISMRGDS